MKDNKVQDQSHNYSRYPLYRDGDILLSDDLNDSFGYLNHQINETRSRLFGHGIMKGLTYEVKKDGGGDVLQITLSDGVAINQQGDLIVLEQEKTFRSCRLDDDQQGTKAHCYVLLEELPTGDTVRDAMPIDADTFSSYHLGVRYRTVAMAEKHCTQDSCTMQSSYHRVVVDAVLLPPDHEGDQVASADEVKLDIDPQCVYGYGSIADYSALPIFVRQLRHCYFSKVRGLTSLLGQLFGHVILSRMANGQAHQLTLPEAEALYEQICQKGFDNERPNLYLSFANDLELAVIELISRLRSFIRDYNLSDYTNTGNKAVVVLGPLDSDRMQSRESFKRVYSDHDLQSDEDILFRHLKRVLMLIQQFEPDSATAHQISCQMLPLTQGMLLGQRPLPRYYDQGEELTDVWDAHNQYHRVEVEATAYCDYHSADRYLLSVEEGVSSIELKRKVRELNLPVLVVSEEMYGDDLSLRLDTLRTESQQHIFNLHQDQICSLLMGTGMIDFEQALLQALIAGSINHLTAFDTAGFGAVLHQHRKGFAKVRDSYLEQIRQAVFMLLEDESKSAQLTPEERMILQFILAGVDDYRHTHSTARHPLPGLDYVDGVMRHDVLLLITYHDRVLLMLNMPYHTYIAQQHRYGAQLLTDETLLAEPVGNLFYRINTVTHL